MSLLRFPLLLILVATLAASTARAGSIRYELPELVGEHRYDTLDPPFFNAIAHVDTPFGFYTARQARLVVEGTVTTGKAHGDGVMYEDLEFDLLPVVGVQPSFSGTVTFQNNSTPDSFAYEYTCQDPFVPETTPLPNPDGYPPRSFQIYLAVRPDSFKTQFPSLIDPSEPGIHFIPPREGIIIDEPIIANITNAYIVFTGPTIVPEPSSLALMVIGLATLCWPRL